MQRLIIKGKKKLKGKIVVFNSLRIPQILTKINNMFNSKYYDS